MEGLLELTDPCLLPLWKGNSCRCACGEVGEGRLSIDLRAAGFEYMVDTTRCRMWRGVKFLDNTILGRGRKSRRGYQLMDERNYRGIIAGLLQNAEPNKERGNSRFSISSIVVDLEADSRKSHKGKRMELW